MVSYLNFFLTNNKKIQKATSAIATAAFPNTGLTRPASGLIAGDRGCLPVGAGTAAAQTTTAQLALAIGGTPANQISDYGSVTTLLCTTSGVCCTTDLCNTMSRIQVSFVAMLMSIALALFGVFNGF